MSSLDERMLYFARLLMDGVPRLGLKGLSQIGAAAVTGNAVAESGVRPLTIGPKDHGSDGILQWRLDRLDRLKSWAGENGFKSWASFEAQAAFTLYELNADYPELAAALREGSKPLSSLTLDFADIFERPSISGRVPEKRVKAANEAMSLIEKYMKEKEQGQGMPGAKAPMDSAPPLIMIIAGLAIAFSYTGLDVQFAAISLSLLCAAVHAVWQVAVKKRPQEAKESGAILSPSIPDVDTMDIESAIAELTEIRQRAREIEQKLSSAATSISTILAK
jgi:hypothetical protein